jgi:hypothetical protein
VRVNFGNAFTVWQQLPAQYGRLLERRPPMLPVADDFLDPSPRLQLVQHIPPKNGAITKDNSPITGKHEPRPPIVADDMATCG